MRLEYLVGRSDSMACVRPLAPYDEVALAFLNDLSRVLLADAEARQYPDVVAFGYWCRRANTARLNRQFAEQHVRLGLGIVFHIAPSNVPISFAFSFAFSLLAGNANIVRVPSRDFPQTSIVCRAIARLLADTKYRKIADMTVFVRYEQNDEITARLSALCNARVIWGGEQAINSVRRLAIPDRSVEIAFADRYSFCVIDGGSVLRASDADVVRLATGFFNDMYLMDQNACSSPHLIVWLGRRDLLEEAKRLFWGKVHDVAKAKYQLQPVNAVDKYMLLCQNAIELENIVGFRKHGNYLYRIELDNLPDNMDVFRGVYGYVYEYDTDNIDRIAHIVNAKYQTLTYFGIDKARLLDFVVTNRLPGIDRIVPIGTALDIGVIWDGYDIVRSLSRIVDVH